MKRLALLLMTALFAFSLFALGCEDTNDPTRPVPTKDGTSSKTDGGK